MATPLRTCSHCSCVKESGIGCISMTVARQRCIFGSVVSKRELKRTQTKTGSRRWWGGGGGQGIDANVNAAKHGFENALFSWQEIRAIGCQLSHSKLQSTTVTAQYERRTCMKAPEGQNNMRRWVCRKLPEPILENGKAVFKIFGNVIKKHHVNESVRFWPNAVGVCSDAFCAYFFDCYYEWK